MVLGFGVSGLSVGVWDLGFCGLGVGFILVLAKCDWQNVADPSLEPSKVLIQAFPCSYNRISEERLLLCISIALNNS